MISGEVRSGPGFWYRLIDASGMTHDEAWLPEPREGDEALESALTAIAAGGELRPGEMLAPFAIDWLVIEGPGVHREAVRRAGIWPPGEIVPVGRR